MLNVPPQSKAALTAALLAAGLNVTPLRAQPAEAVEAVEEAVGAVPDEAASDGFAGDRERASYAIGADIGTSFRTQGVEVDPGLLQEAFRAAYAGEELRLTPDQSRAALAWFQQTMFAKQQAQASEAGLANRAQGEAFLDENQAREGVVVTESGLQYEITERGEGALAGPNDTVIVHYRGTLLSGEEFDSSYARGQPASFPVAAVIPGFSEGLQLMPVGSKGKLFISADLGYGDSPQGPGGPGSTLVFEVEVVDIETPPAPPSLEEQIAQAQEQMEQDIQAIRAQAEGRIQALRSQLGESTPEPEFPIQYD